MARLWTSIAMLISLVVTLCNAAPTDGGDKDLQKEKIVFGEETNLRIADGYAGIWHLEPDRFMNGEAILYSWGSALRTDIYNIAGSIDLEDYIEGTGIAARFRKIVGFLQISKTQVVIADSRNHCLRLLDRTTSSTSHLAGRCTEYGYVDGVGGDARFQEPSSVVLDQRDNKSLIVVDNWNNALRSFNMKTKQVSTIVQDHENLHRPRFALFDNKDKDTLYVGVSFHIVKYSFVEDSISVIAGQFERLGYADGKFDEVRFGYFPGDIVQLDSNHLAVADFWNQDVRLINLQLKQVTSICEPKYNESFIEGVGCKVDRPHGLLYYNGTLYVGDASTVQMIPVSIVEAGKSLLSCKPRDMTAVIPAGQKTIAVKVDSDHTLTLAAGRHQFMSEGCIVNLKVMGGAISCPSSINRVVTPDTGRAVIDLMVYGISQRFELPIGQYPFTMKIEDDLMCQFSINVFDANMERRIEFQADYNYDCASLDIDATKYLVESMVENNLIHILEVCNGVCSKKDKDGKVTIKCADNILSVYYPTDLVYNGAITSIPQSTYDQLTARLVSKGTMMSIVDPSKRPPVIFPRGTANGSSAKVVLTTSCLNKKTYNEATDTCV